MFPLKIGDVTFVTGTETSSVQIQKGVRSRSSAVGTVRKPGTYSS